jgi:hypothetical protein
MAGICEQKKQIYRACATLRDALSDASRKKGTSPWQIGRTVLPTTFSEVDSENAEMSMSH